MIDDQQLDDHLDLVEISAFLTKRPQQLGCSFKMIRASFPTRVGKQGVFRLYMESAQLRSQRGLARTTDQCEIRCERECRYNGAQPSPPACRSGSRPGSSQAHSLWCAESDVTQHHVAPTRPDVRVLAPSVCRSHVQPASLPVAAQPAHERPLGPDPCRGTTTGRNDSRCAGITK
jgi:hypothetical protein